MRTEISIVYLFIDESDKSPNLFKKRIMIVIYPSHSSWLRRRLRCDNIMIFRLVSFHSSRE